MVPYCVQKKPALPGPESKGQEGQWEQNSPVPAINAIKWALRLYTSHTSCWGKGVKVKRAAAMGEDGQWASDLISHPAFLLTGLHFLY